MARLGPHLVLTATVALLLLAPHASAQTPEDLASSFLTAWIYRDYQTVWSALDDESRAGLTPESLAEALERLPIVAESAEIVSTDAESDGFHVRFRLSGVHPTSGQPTTLPGTLTITPAPDGTPLVHFRVPNALGAQHAAPEAVPSSRAALPPSQVIDGLSAQDILRRAAEATGQISSLRMGLSVTSNMMGQGVAMRGEFLYLAPNQMRLDLSDVLFVTDGLNGTLYLPATNTYFRVPTAFGSDLIGLAPGLAGAASQVPASLISRDEIGGRPAWHLAVAPDSGGGGSTLIGPVGIMHIWLDAESYLPRRVQGGAMGMAMDLSINSIDVNPAGIAPESFHFTPPAGAMEVPMMLPGLGGG
jgi:outer membrane lipoprotein-sorting protein